MGIRIHKCLCYALNDVKSVDDKIIDERFSDKILNDNQNFEDYLFSDKARSDFLQWAWDNKDGKVLDILREVKGTKDFEGKTILDFCFSAALNSVFNKEKSNWNIKLLDMYNTYISPDHEYHMNSVCAFVPISHSSWFRYDDSIDYYVNLTGDEDGKGENSIVEIKYGIYPYSSMMYKKSVPGLEGIEFPEDIKHLVMKGRSEFLSSCDFEMLTNSKHSRISKSSIDFLLNNFRPCIPDEIFLYTYYFGFFKDWIKTSQELKSYLYTFWS